MADFNPDPRFLRAAEAPFNRDLGIIRRPEDIGVLYLGAGRTVKSFAYVLNDIEIDGKKIYTGQPVVCATPATEDFVRKELGWENIISLKEAENIHKYKLCVDGLDEATEEKDVLKGTIHEGSDDVWIPGNQGEYAKEKLQAIDADFRIFIGDSSKRVDYLGQNCKLPVTVPNPFLYTEMQVIEYKDKVEGLLGNRVKLRHNNRGKVYENSSGDSIWDVEFDSRKIENLISIESELFLGNGLFVNPEVSQPHIALIAHDDGVEKIE